LRSQKNYLVICDRNYSVQAGRKLNILLKDDCDRLGAIFGQVHP